MSIILLYLSKMYYNNYYGFILPYFLGIHLYFPIFLFNCVFFCYSLVWWQILLYVCLCSRYYGKVWAIYIQLIWKSCKPRSPAIYSHHTHTLKIIATPRPAIAATQTFTTLLDRQGDLKSDIVCRRKTKSKKIGIILYYSNIIIIMVLTKNN